MLRALILLSPIFIYTNSYAQVAKIDSIGSINSLEKRSAMSNMVFEVFEVFKDHSAHGKKRNISKVGRKKIAHYDFTTVIAASTNHQTIGIIGDNYQRLIMDIDHVTKDPQHPNRYLVSGYAQVRKNITDFQGSLTLADIYRYDRFDYGVDEEYRDKGLTEQGFAVFHYQLTENPQQRYSGVFEGQLYSKWYLTDDGVMHYDFIDYYSDSYFNNVYYGTWRAYDSDQSKMATWADYKLPREIAPDLNIGAGDFSPNPKYFKYGWADYQPK